VFTPQSVTEASDIKTSKAKKNLFSRPPIADHQRDFSLILVFDHPIGETMEPLDRFWCWRLWLSGAPSEQQVTDELLHQALHAVCQGASRAYPRAVGQAAP
jgi:hypothetical protein